MNRQATHESDAAVLAARVLDAWNSHDVERVLACYTEDLRYRDPNTRGEVVGRAAMRQYLTRLFGTWRMHWSARDIMPLGDRTGFTVLWSATLQKTSGGQSVEVDGMDLVVLAGDRISYNEVRFDRTPLLSLGGFEAP